MKFLYNMKVKVKFLGSFFLLIIAMIAVGILGISGMNTINTANNFVYENNYKSTVSIETFNAGLSDVRQVTQKLVNAANASKIDTVLAEIDKYAAFNNNAMAEYKDSIVTDEDQALYDQLTKALADYRVLRNNLVEMVKSGDYTQANTYNAETVDPSCQIVQDLIDDTIAYNQHDAQNNVDIAQNEFESSTMLTIVILIISALLAVLIGLVMANVITKPLNAVRDVAEKIADGDLRVKLADRFLQQKDEIGMLANNIEDMKLGLIHTVSGIKHSSDDLGNQVTSTNETLTTLNDRISDTSAATEELSAGMEETGASAEEMNATASEIERAVETVAEKAEEGASKSSEIHSRAANLGKNVNESIQKSNSIFNEIKVTLEKALDDSKAVDEINALADAILGITSQTTLLALNASIEAARAGEAGKGFAVVANEISALADNSKNTVTQIQAITKVVMNAVNALANSSTNLLNFVANDVTKDYNDMLAAADSYTTDAVYVSDMTNDLSATSEELLASVQVLMRAITEVSAAAQEGAKTTSIVAEQTTDISANASVIVDNMKQTQGTSDELVNLVNKFQL